MKNKTTNQNTPPKPPPLLPGWVANFETMKRAHNEGALALVSATRASNGEAVALVCAMEILSNGDRRPIPFAEMVMGNPFELYNDPTTI